MELTTKRSRAYNEKLRTAYKAENGLNKAFRDENKQQPIESTKARNRAKMKATATDAEPQQSRTAGIVSEM